LTISLGFLTLNPLSAAVLIALLAGVAIVSRRLALSLAVDLTLAGLAGAVIGGRALHVLLNWGYFGAHPAEALSLYAGGLDWHGALVGGLAGVWVLRRVIPFPPNLLDTFALLLPLLALASWAGCGAVGCGYGAEVPTLADYPPFAVSESADLYGIIAPRWNTPLFGMALAVLIGLIVLLCMWRGWPRFWLAVALLSAGMFALGFVRGDASPQWLGLRADQLLDIGLLAVSFWRLAFSRAQRKIL
jgi:phosphatidylglycerol---prolipoprotein diacylglyceryl transferase